jgi:biopolymer transport protein ExbB
MGGLWMIGGPILWVIFACGAVGLAVFVERSLHLHRARIKSEDFVAGIMNIVKRGNIEESLTICRETPGPVARVVMTAILSRREGRDEVRRAVEDAALSEISRMERRLVAVSTVAQIAPLLGLLGTVLGFIEFLLAMQNDMPLVQSADVLRAMLRALTSTAAGLSVAVPAYVGFNLLVVKIDRIVLDMNRAGSEMIAFLSARKE